MDRGNLGRIFYLISGGFICYGFYKIFAYKNLDSILDSGTNAYVGGDAYNYIINSNYATGYFVLALLFTILGSTMLILEKMDDNKSKEDNHENSEKEKTNS
ncbi:hypothetical protein [Clostridiisalibacter paucivorans]|uniref:hypothetical protein n=1 Tax=Clostridiisalibacter paucivorans TaxID=408753 RepID=UPI000A87794C|nr:hypothetical protein [Clostridiisalibacter paucivorans]